MTFTNKLDLLRTRNNIRSIRQLAACCNLPNTTLQSFYDKGYDNMRISNLKAICDYFNVTLDSMAYDDREIEYRIGHKGLSTADHNILALYHNADEEVRKFVYNSLEDHCKRKEEQRKENLREKESSLRA